MAPTKQTTRKKNNRSGLNRKSQKTKTKKSGLLQPSMHAQIPALAVTQQVTITLTDIRKSDRPELVEITGKPHIMKFVGPGKTWTPADVDKYINYTIQDAGIPTQRRTWFSYAIRDQSNSKLVGVIEFKCISIYHILPFNLRQKYKNDVALTIYINDTHQGKGIARMAIEQLKTKIRKLKPHARKLISLVKSSNQVMQQAMIKLGFTNLGLIGGTPTLIVYAANIK